MLFIVYHNFPLIYQPKLIHLLIQTLQQSITIKVKLQKYPMIDILSFQPTLYFAFGQPQKTSLIAEFCRQNKYEHFKNPTLQTLQKPLTASAIVQGSIELFNQVEAVKPTLQVIFIGKVFSEQELKIKRDYRKIGKCIQVSVFNYEQFRKAVYPNLVFFYGPIEQQNVNCGHALASQIGYLYVHLPPSANNFISEFKKTVNYVVCGLFTQKSQLQILEQYFNIKVIHLKYNRIDLPGCSDYFDKQFELLNFLKSKPYYYSVSGLYNDIKIIDDVSEMLSPTLVYCRMDEQKQLYEQERQYLNDYVNRNEHDTIVLSLDEVEQINRRKGVRAPQNSFQKTILLNEILYRDFNIKRAFILKFPSTLNEVLNFESDNRKFEAFVDLAQPESNNFVEEFVTPMYFLQNQLRITPNTSKSLESYLNSSINYWLVHGVSGSGKTTVAKFLASQYGFKLIEYEPYFASVKEKLLAPEDGEQVPLRKVLAHFKSLLSQNLNDTYVIDGLPFDNKDLEEWIKVIGVPSVINVEVDLKESILRTRKKNQGDLKEQIKEEQQTKANQSKAKADSWLQKVQGVCPGIEINQLNFNGTLIQSQKLIHKLFKKNVYLVQRHNSLTFQNVALKYNLALINLHMTPLKQSLQKIRKIANKDVILCFYHQQQEKLVSEDLYWIQKNIGNIRYLAINEPEEINAHEQKIQLQRPKAPEKPKVQGAEGEQKPPEQQPAGQKKDVFDIYAYEWTKPSNPKNLSQWFMKSKKKVEKVESSSGRQVFEKWLTVVRPLAESDQTAIYHRFK